VLRSLATKGDTVKKPPARTKTDLKQQIAEATKFLNRLREEYDPELLPLITKGEEMVAVAKVELQILEKLAGKKGD
jgi:hypothetical protein